MDVTWKALSEPVRREIVELLRDSPRTTGELCDAFGHLTRFGVMNHIAVLKDADLIRVEKKGRERINSLNPGPLQELYEDWMREYEVLWAGRLGRLKKMAETAEAKEREKRMQDTSWIGEPLASLHIEQKVDIDASPATVFAGLTEGIGNWWGAPYLLSGDRATDIVLDPRPGGLFLEVTGEGEGYVWCTVEQIVRDRLLTLSGRMAMRDAVAGLIRFELEPLGDGTRLSLEHRAVGRLTEGDQDAFAEGWKDLLGARLKAHAESGEVMGIRARL